MDWKGRHIVIDITFNKHICNVSENKLEEFCWEEEERIRVSNYISCSRQFWRNKTLRDMSTRDTCCWQTTSGWSTFLRFIIFILFVYECIFTISIMLYLLCLIWTKPHLLNNVKFNEILIFWMKWMCCCDVFSLVIYLILWFLTIYLFLSLVILWLNNSLLSWCIVLINGFQ